MTRQLPAAARAVLRDALAEARAAGLRDPEAMAEHAAHALVAYGWTITAHRTSNAPQTAAQHAA